MLQRLREVGLKIHPKKNDFCRKSVVFQRFGISKINFKMDLT